MKQPKTKEFSLRALGRFADYCHANPGTISKVVVRLGEVTGATQYRQNIEEYLHREPAKRVEPRLGLGVAIMMVAAEYIGHALVTTTGVDWPSAADAVLPPVLKSLRKPKAKKAKRAKAKAKGKRRGKKALTRARARR
jgi:hypothetical protein